MQGWEEVKHKPAAQCTCLAAACSDILGHGDLVERTDAHWCTGTRTWQLHKWLKQGKKIKTCTNPCQRERAGLCLYLCVCVRMWVTTAGSHRGADCGNTNTDWQGWDSTKGRAAAGFCSNQSSAPTLTNQLSDDSYQLIQWVQSRLLLDIFLKKDMNKLFRVERRVQPARAEGKKSNMNTMFHNATFILTYIQLRVQLVNTTLGCLVIIPTMSFKDTHNMVKSVSDSWNPGITNVELQKMT